MTGGKQVTMAPGQVVDVERLEGDPGSKVSFDQVILVKTDAGTKIGAPMVNGAKVSAVIELQDRDQKVLIRKFKRRHKYLRTRGHRQYFTRVRIESISA